jgi:hypothetical protein
MRTGLNAMVAVVVASALVVAPETLRATAQVPDRIEIDGKPYALLVNPLEDYFDRHPERRPSSPARSSSNWRGYVATFAIVNDQLVVANVHVTLGTGERRSVLAEVFPGDARPVVKWFTGNLVVGDGEVVRYVHMGYGSEYERYIVVTVKAGAAAKPRRLSHAEFGAFRRTQFEAYQRTDEYQKQLKEARRSDPRLDVAQFERFMFDFSSADYVTRVIE